MGRPRKYTTGEEFSTKVEEYFNTKGRVISKDLDIRVYTMSGLCLYLGITRETLSEYSRDPMFTDTIKRARMRVENNLEELALLGAVDKTVAIFSLKNNFGWKDNRTDDEDREQPAPVVVVEFEDSSMEQDEIEAVVNGDQDDGGE